MTVADGEVGMTKDDIIARASIVANFLHFTIHHRIYILVMRLKVYTMVHRLSTIGTTFHEMVHSTGAENQLNRLKPQSGFGSDEYAREELVAELGSALVCQKYGMTKNLKEDSAAYLKSWLGSLKESPSFIKTTLMDVKKATSILTQRIDDVALEMKEQQSENVAASVSDEKKDAKDMKQSASSDNSELTEAEDEKVARSAFRR